MSLENDVKKWFIQAIEMNPMTSPELKRAIKSTHGGRLDTYTKALAQEFMKADQVQIKRGKSAFKKDTIKSAVKDFAEVWVRNIENEAKRRIESDISKSIRDQKEQERKDLESTANGKAAGEFEEYIKDGSLIIDEKVVGQRPH